MALTKDVGDMELREALTNILQDQLGEEKLNQEDSALLFNLHAEMQLFAAAQLPTKFVSAGLKFKLWFEVFCPY